MSHSNKQVRDLIKWAERHGWTFQRRTRSGHVLMHHENGATVTFSSNTADWRAVRNARADLEREAKRERDR